MEKDGIVFGSIAVLQTIVTVSQTNEVFQTIQIIISALAGAVALAYTIWRWYRNAKKDGKITEDEVDDLINTVFKEDFKNHQTSVLGEITKKEDSEDEHRD